MIDSLLKLTGIVIALLILWRAEPALNRMSDATHWMVRYALLMIAAGAMALLLYTLAGKTPDITSLFLAVGLALMLICERRLRYLLPTTQRRPQHAQR